MLTRSPAWRSRLPRRWTGRVRLTGDALLMPLRNRDGAPVDVRDRANRAWLHGERARLEAELGRWDAAHPPTRRRLRLPRRTRGDRLRSRLRALDGLQMSLDTYTDIRLIAFDCSGKNVKAIVAHGNPEIADHVVVSVPGMGAQVDFACTVEGMARETASVRDEALAQLERVGRGGETVAAVAWIWYDTPPWQGSAALRGRAFRAAPALAKYLRAVRETSVHPRLHLTLVGHSYGSLVAGLALHDGAGAVVDDYVAYGSAGFYARDEAQLGMEPGRVFVMLAPDDWIRFPAQLGLFGGDPAAGAFTRLSTAAATTADGVRRDGASGHAGYPRSFSLDGREMLFTTGYNVAVVAAGLTELAVRL
ncbi:MAG: hypothetical protein QOH60_3037 [Mycobacterium sp.]|nr:hypothetical protein [Mycobacterium sp.]